jgi:hypothetical protein
MRHLAMLTTALFIFGIAACSSTEKPTPMADCCKKTADLKAQIPKCCATGDSDCCKASKADPSKTADCCKKAQEISANLPECCKKQAAGQPQACCTAK